QIIPFFSRPIEYIPPTPGDRILHLLYGCGISLQYGFQGLPAGMPGRKIVERIDQRHPIPAHGPRPKIGRVARLFVRPRLLPRLVPAVIKQPRPWIAGMLFDQRELPRDIVEYAVLMEKLRIFGKE